MLFLHLPVFSCLLVTESAAVRARPKTCRLNVLCVPLPETVRPKSDANAGTDQLLTLSVVPAQGNGRRSADQAFVFDHVSRRLPESGLCGSIEDDRHLRVSDVQGLPPSGRHLTEATASFR
jgi:hypothetical protein